MTSYFVREGVKRFNSYVAFLSWRSQNPHIKITGVSGSRAEFDLWGPTFFRQPDVIVTYKEIVVE